MDIAGEFETHVTVALMPTQPMELLQGWASAHGLKCLHILLARGLHASQPMLTRRGSGAHPEVLAQADQLRHQLEQAGFVVTRVKVEAAATNIGVPQTDRDASEHSRDRYFEHHVKLLITEQTDLAKLTQLAQQHGAHLSRNALRARADGTQERFVTQRCMAVGRTRASQHLEKLVSDLSAAMYRIVDVEEEFVIYDTNVEFDAGWLQAQERCHV